jgi:hypothetical protein
MSDIRLHTLRSSRNRNTYARLDSNSAQHQPLHEPPSATTTTTTNTFASGSGSGSPMPMRASLNAAAASAVASSSRRKKGRRRHEYGEGEPEEEATLLGDSEHDPGFLPDDEEDRPIRAERAHDVASQVRTRVATPPFRLMMTSRGLRRQRSVFRRRSKDKSRTVPLRPPGA